MTTRNIKPLAERDIRISCNGKGCRESVTVTVPRDDVYPLEYPAGWTHVRTPLANGGMLKQDFCPPCSYRRSVNDAGGG